MAGRPRTDKSYEDYLEYQRQALASYYARNKDKILAKQRQKRTEQQLKEEELLILEAEKKSKEDKIRALEEELAKLKGDDENE